MGGSSSSDISTSQTQNQSGSTNPWAPAIPALNNILGQISNTSTQPTNNQNAATSGLIGASQGLPNFGGQAAAATTSMLPGGDIYNTLNNGYSDLQKQLNPIANGSLDPTQAPGMSNVLQTIRNDVGNSVNSQFAGAGRDLSGLNQQSLARGIAQGEAVPLLNQYNANVGNIMGAANSLYGGANSTATGLSGIAGAGLGAAAAQPGIAQAPALAQLGAANTQYGQPLQNLGLLSQLTVPIAGLGGQYQGTSTGTGTSQTNNQMSGAQQFGLIANGLGSLFKSDRRAKRAIEQVGKLFDGTPVYRFEYIDAPGVQIGLMADEVEQYAPHAVHEIEGVKYVNYAEATQRAINMGAQ